LPQTATPAAHTKQPQNDSFPHQPY